MKFASSTILLSILTTCLAASPTQAQAVEPMVLPAPDQSGGVPLMQALKNRKSTKEFATKTVAPEEISSLLWAAFGINRPESGKRTVATAVNCQDIDIYVVLEKAVYVYQAEENRLSPVVARDVRTLAATQEYAQAAPINLVYVSDYSKMGDFPQDKKPIYAAFHAGSISQNVYLYCASAGLGAVVRDSVNRDALKEALNLKEDQFIVMAQSVGYAPSP